MIDNNSSIATSPLRQNVTEFADGLMSEQPFASKFLIRGDADSAHFNAVFEKVSLTLPGTPNTWTSNAQFDFFWMGPDEWLLRAKPQAEEQDGGSSNPANPEAVGDHVELFHTLKDALQKQHAAIVDVSDYYTVIRIDHPQARDILARSCPLDFHRALSQPFQCAQTRLGNASCLINETSKSSSDGMVTAMLDVQVRWSYAEYVWDLLKLSARFVNN